jgi:hypothetical protein
VAIGVPAAVRAAVGRPRALRPAWLLAFAAVLTAQTVGELGGLRTGVLGEAHILLAAIGAGLASLTVAAVERFRG